jgi:glyceraldehyde-3-phosphate dehydrogenase (NADP+)
VAAAFSALLVARVAALPAGPPWLPGVAVTPLAGAHPARASHLRALVADAVARGATVLCGGGEQSSDGWSDGGDGLLRPVVLSGVDASMRVWREEQFGPLVPLAAVDAPADALAHIRDSEFGQQAAVFARDPREAAPVVAALRNLVSRVNLNCQCSRSPDALPFGGRKSSALGTVSVSDTLKMFSTEAVVAARDSGGETTELLLGIDTYESNK